MLNTWLHIRSVFVCVSSFIPNPPVFENGVTVNGTAATYSAPKTYLSSIEIGNKIVDVNGNKDQGFWVLEFGESVLQGQTMPGSITVPNPLHALSPIPSGSSVITGRFDEPFTVSSNREASIEITVTFSINNSFEWIEVNPDGKFEPSIGERIIDFGVRGLSATVSYR